MNPTTDVLEQRIATLEDGSAALCTAWDVCNISCDSLIVSNGDHIIASSSLYGGTDTFFRYTLPKMGVRVDFVENLTPEKVSQHMLPNTKLVYLETLEIPRVMCWIPRYLMKLIITMCL